jgi:hypothetical protein
MEAQHGKYIRGALSDVDTAEYVSFIGTVIVKRRDFRGFAEQSVQIDRMPE